MIFVKVIIFTLSLLVMSSICGYAFHGLKAVLSYNREEKPVSYIADGFVISIGITVLLLKLFGIFKLSAAMGLIIAVLVEISAAILILIVVNKKYKAAGTEAMSGGLKAMWQGFRCKKRQAGEDDGSDKRAKMHLLILIAIMVVEIAGVMLYSLKIAQAVEKVKDATLIYDSGILNPSAWMMNLWGCIAAVFRLHPLSVIYTLIPIALIAMYHVCYYDLLLLVSKEDKSAAIVGMLVIAILNLWGYQSDALIGYSLLTGYFQTACFILQALVPFIVKHMIVYLRSQVALTQPRSGDNQPIESGAAFGSEESFEYQEEWDMKKHKIINARNLAIALGLLAVAMLALVFVLNNKINTLHDSTVNLQQALNDRCAVYEFSTAPGKAEGYLIQGSDGSLTMIGGGAEENAQALYDFLEEHGTNLTAWYLYGTDLEDAGACAICVNHMGVSVGETFILDRYKIPTGE